MYVCLFAREVVFVRLNRIYDVNRAQASSIEMYVVHSVSLYTNTYMNIIYSPVRLINL